MIVLTRIDSRLIHGQVIEAWVPHLKIDRLLVLDDEAAHNPLMRAAMTMAVPHRTQVQLVAMEQVDLAAIGNDALRTLVLVRDVGAAVAARAHGLPDGPINVGNIHSGLGRTQVTRSVFLTDVERAQLKQLETGGMKISLQAVPNEDVVPIAL